jgi:hypothetical protein
MQTKKQYEVSFKKNYSSEYRQKTIQGQLSEIAVFRIQTKTIQGQLRKKNYSSEYQKKQDEVSSKNY